METQRPEASSTTGPAAQIGAAIWTRAGRQLATETETQKTIAVGPIRPDRPAPSSAGRRYQLLRADIAWQFLRVVDEAALAITQQPATSPGGRAAALLWQPLDPEAALFALHCVTLEVCSAPRRWARGGVELDLDRWHARARAAPLETRMRDAPRDAE